MESKPNIPKYLMFNAFLVFFIVHTTQMGVGVTGIQRVLYLEAKHDAWISIILASIVTHIVIIVILRTVKYYPNHTLFEIHTDVYGKWLGKAVNVIFIGYFLLLFTSIILGYIEIVQVWIFTDIPNWLIGLILILLSIKGVSGGIRVITGFCFIAFLSAIWLLVIFFIEPLRYANWNYLFPILEATPKELSNGMLKTTFSMLGFEVLYMVYPFIKEKDKVAKYAHLGQIATALILVIITIIAIVFFSEGQLERTIWATLSMLKIVRLPVLERFEYLAIPLWMIIILPNLLLYMWSASKGVKITIGIKQRYALYGLSTIAIAVVSFVSKRIDINTFIDTTGYIGLVLCYIYPFLLFIIVLLKQFRKSKYMEET